MSTYRFLVVDDTSFMRKMASDYLKQFGHEVAGEASNGKEAVRLYEELRPDVVLMDLTMPEMNGTEALKRILDLNPEAVVLICSASNQQEQILEALEAGAKGYLLKPFNPERLQEVIQEKALPFLSAVPSPAEAENPPAFAEAAAQDAAAVQVPAAMQEAAAAQEPVEMNPTPITNRVRRSDKMKGFVSSLICNWEEEGSEGTVRYSVVCTESENKLVIEMKDEQEEKRVIPFSIEGFRHLAGWLDDHLGSVKSVKP